MIGAQVTNGCIYASRFTAPSLPGKNRCSFHDYTIFSAEVRDYTLDQHAEINKEFDVSTQRSIKNVLRQTIPIGDNLYCKLTYCFGGSVIKCVGVFVKPFSGSVMKKHRPFSSFQLLISIDDLEGEIVHQSEISQTTSLADSTGIQKTHLRNSFQISFRKVQ